jgi:acetylornithine aminotransferase
MLGVLLTEPIAPLLTQAALDGGLLVNAIGGSVIRLLPALTLTEAEADEAVTRLGASFAAVATRERSKAGPEEAG